MSLKNGPGKWYLYWNSELGGSRNLTTILRDIGCLMVKKKSCEFPKLFRCLQETFKSFNVYMKMLVLLFYKYALTIAKYQLTK